jgi:hypothetical protein
MCRDIVSSGMAALAVLLGRLRPLVPWRTMRHGVLPANGDINVMQAPMMVAQILI